jgi:beta-galactosidase
MKINILRGIPSVFHLCLGTLLWISPLGLVSSQEPTPQGPLETLSPVRERTVLNGLWKCMPAVGPAADAPAGDWGSMWVPGSWIGGFARKGTGPEWHTLGTDLHQVWYERQIDVPGSWTGRRVVLDFRRVSTEAVVTVNGVACGEVPWPFGRVDITKAVKPGAKAELRVLVKANAEQGEHELWMGTNAGQRLKASNRLSTAGLIGEVFLLSEPLGPAVSDVFVKTSVRKRAVTLDVEVTGMTEAETAPVTATMINATGQAEQVFRGLLPLRALAVQRAELTFPWANPVPWSPEQPNLYTLQLTVAGKNIRDIYPQRFGFREFWVSGRQFFLNGQEIRLRPTDLGGSEPTTIEGIDGYIKGIRAAGFNIIEMRPVNHDQRGYSSQNRELWCERADEKGFLTIGDALDFGDYLAKTVGKARRLAWFDPGVREKYQARLDAEMRRYRNSPAVVMWSTLPNRYGHLQDQNPRTIGIRGIRFPLPDWALQDVGYKAAYDGLNVIRAVDPTRPVYSHAGDMVGDVYTVNNYLNFIPLQEREEWLSNYAEKADMPYMAVEFGLPLGAPSMQRGRNSFGNASKTEPLLTEFCAIYLGPNAYRLEAAEYRAAIVSKYGVEGKKEWSSFHNAPVMNQAPAFRELESLFIRNTWRAWRGAGITGGMVPWDVTSQVFKRVPAVDRKGPLFQPGLRGAYRGPMQDRLAYFLDTANGWEAPAPAQALIEVNGPTLAWIAGAPENFYEKAHSFRPGQTVKKQICLINDLPAEASYHLTWRVVLADKPLHEESADGTIGVASNLFLPLKFSVPEVIRGDKLQGEIVLEATIGQRTSTDRFPFRVWNPDVADLPKMFLYDPAGKTAKLLKNLGASAIAWNGEPPSKDRPLLVVGCKAFGAAKKALAADLEKFVAAGGRLLVMSQDPDWMRKSHGFRMSRVVSRRVFPVMAGHPITAGLDADDLRDWAGAGSLIEARPVYDLKANTNYGWHWGNQGSVSCSMVEKPHLSGWTPILQGEFDLAYSPLMQLGYGKGSALLCTLDLEDQAPVDPVAEILARRILRQAVGPDLPPRRKTVYLGGEADAKLLRSMGLLFDQGAALPAPETLAVIGSGAAVTAEQIKSLADQGGNVLILFAPAGQNLVGQRIENQDGFFGTSEFQSTFDTPLMGLGVSDLHYRVGLAWPVLVKAGTVSAAGLISAQPSGKGTLVSTQLDPRRLDADKLPYLRFTRWRQTRALCQLLANLGASFAADGQLFHADAKVPLYYPDYDARVWIGDDPAHYYRW